MYEGEAELMRQKAKDIAEYVRLLHLDLAIVLSRIRRETARSFKEALEDALVEKTIVQTMEKGRMLSFTEIKLEMPDKMSLRVFSKTAEDIIEKTAGRIAILIVESIVKNDPETKKMLDRFSKFPRVEQIKLEAILRANTMRHIREDLMRQAGLGTTPPSS